LGSLESSTDLLVSSQLEDCQRESKLIAEVEQRTPDLPQLIVAGNAWQAAQYAAREKLPPKSWRYVATPDSLLGASNRRVVWVGTFWEHRHFDRICQEVDQLVRLGFVVVDRNEVVNRGSKTRPKANPETGTSAGASPDAA
jgi:hypothetical protein